MIPSLEKKGPHPQLAPWGFPRAIAQALGRYQLDWPWTQAFPLLSAELDDHEAQGRQQSGNPGSS